MPQVHDQGAYMQLLKYMIEKIFSFGVVPHATPYTPCGSSPDDARESP